MNRLTVDSRNTKKIKKGIQLLDESVAVSETLQGSLVSVYSQKKEYLGTAYLSEQNKGKGWMISDKEVTLSVSFFQSLFEEARKKRYSFAQSPLTSAYRLFNQDGDGFGGFSADRYNDFVVFSWYNQFVYEHKTMILEAFQSVFPDIVGGYEKIRFKTSDLEDSYHSFGEKVEVPLAILENGVSYSVFLNDGLMTGIFLDQHDVRGRLVDGLASGKSVLNLFSYTAAFSVAAAMGGASQTVSVDLAKRSRELSEAHFKLNHIDQSLHRLVVMDVFEYLSYAKRKSLKFDIIIIDPPSFARNKKQTFSVSKDYHKLIKESLELLHPGGVIIASTNASNLSITQFKKQLELGFGETSYHEISLQQLPADFTVNPADESSNYLKVFTMKVSE